MIRGSIIPAGFRPPLGLNTAIETLPPREFTVLARLQTIAPNLASPLDEVVFLFDMRTAPHEECEPNHQGSNDHDSPTA